MFLVPVKNLLNNTTLLHKLLVKTYSYLLLAYCTVFWWLPSHFPSWRSCDVLKWPQKRGAKGTRPFYTSTLRVQLSLHIYNVWQGLTYRVWSGTVSCWLSVTVLWSSVLRWRIPQSDSYFDRFTTLVDPRHTWLHFRLGSSPNRRRDKWPRVFRAKLRTIPRQVPGWKMEWYFTKRPHSCVLAWSGPPARWEMTDLSLFFERVAFGPTNDGCLFGLGRELMPTYVYQHWSVTVVDLHFIYLSVT